MNDSLEKLLALHTYAFLVPYYIIVPISSYPQDFNPLWYPKSHSSDQRINYGRIISSDCYEVFVVLAVAAEYISELIWRHAVELTILGRIKMRVRSRLKERVSRDYIIFVPSAEIIWQY